MASALVLHPGFDIEWGYKAAAGAMIGLVLTPYVIFIWYILKNNCHVDGEICSYEKNVEGRKPSDEENQEATPKDSKACFEVMKTKKGLWHGGRKEKEADWAWRHMKSAVESVLTVLQSTAVVSRFSDESPLATMIEDLEKLHERYQNFGIGNAFTWCCPCCNSAPESRIKAALRKIADELQIEVVSTDEPSQPLTPERQKRRASTGRLESTLSNVEWVDHIKIKVLLRTAIEKCQHVSTTRAEAQKFLAEFGSNFRRFDASNRYMDVALLAHVLLFSLCVGLMQEYGKAQASVAFGLYFALTCYMCTNPFNEYLRFPFELASVICFSIALLLVLLYNFEVLTDPVAVGTAVNYLSIGSVAFKILYQVVATFPFYLKLIRNCCCPPDKVEEPKKIGAAGTRRKSGLSGPAKCDLDQQSSSPLQEKQEKQETPSLRPWGEADAGWFTGPQGNQPGTQPPLLADTQRAQTYNGTQAQWFTGQQHAPRSARRNSVDGGGQPRSARRNSASTALSFPAHNQAIVSRDGRRLSAPSNQKIRPKGSRKGSGTSHYIRWVHLLKNEANVRVGLKFIQVANGFTVTGVAVVQGQTGIDSVCVTEIQPDSLAAISRDIAIGECPTQ